MLNQGLRLAAAFASLALIALPSLVRAADSTASSPSWVGQVVCAVCWFEADRATVPYGSKADLECAAACAKKGVPQVLAVKEANEIVLYELDGDGPPGTPRRTWLDLTGQQVRVEGRSFEAAGKKRLAASRVVPVPVAAAAPAPAPRGEPVELTLRDLDGKEARLAELRGKIVVVNFWATWCGPCRAEMPLLARLAREYRPRGVELVAAAGDGIAPRVQQFLADAKLELARTWLGANASDLARFGLGEALPGTAILDRSGRVVWRHTGVVSEPELRAELDRLAPAAAR